MTGMLASVRSTAEARIAISAGVDLIDLKEPSAGALGALSEATVRRIVKLVAGRRPVSATIGDLPCAAGPIDGAVRRMSACGVDLVKVGIFAAGPDRGVLRALEHRCAAGTRVILVFFAEFWRGGVDFRQIRRAGIEGVMLDTADKQGGPLTRRLGRNVLADFVREAKAAGLLAGLAGSLGDGDVRRLLPLQPDYLGFRGALCAGRGRGGRLDPDAVSAIRALLGPARTVVEGSPARTAA